MFFGAGWEVLTWAFTENATTKTQQVSKMILPVLIKAFWNFVIVYKVENFKGWFWGSIRKAWDKRRGDNFISLIARCY
jgi:hypothetical protein